MRLFELQQPSIKAEIKNLQNKLAHAKQQGNHAVYLATKRELQALQAKL